MPILQDHGDYHYRTGDVDHVNDLVSIANLQDAARNKNKSAYDMFAKAPDDQVRKCCLRGMVDFRSIDKNLMVPTEEVEPAGNIVKRFVTGAMSCGSISDEARRTLAVAMNRMGGKSNTGEGGEDMGRWTAKENGDSEKSAIKQVASGRFGVTIASAIIKHGGFMKYARQPDPYRDMATCTKDFGELQSRHDDKNLKIQAARCMDCGVPFCQTTATGCPLGNIIPTWNDLVYNGKCKEALYTLLSTNSFPEFTGRVCPALCEGACVLGINADPVSIKSIECGIIDKAFDEGWMKPQIPVRTGKQAAVIGPVPAGPW